MKESGVRTVRSFCRICSAGCGMVVKIDGRGRIAKIAGDHDHRQTMGFACTKGLVADEAHHGPQRILRPLKRMPDGSHTEISLDQAMAEISARLGKIVTDHGGNAVAGYRGTMHYLHSTAFQMLGDWLSSLGSRSIYSTMTIDQSAKWVAEDRLGTWQAGPQTFESADIMMVFGANPLVSMTTRVFPTRNPQKRLKAAKRNGFRLIVIDPRVSETARYADLHLRPLPGEDAAIAAGLLHVILREGWEDREFCARWVNGLEDLRAAVAPFTPDYVAARAGISAGELESAARMFASEGHRGCAVSGTGPDMGPHSNLAEQLIQTINVVCGRFARTGDPLNPCVLRPRSAPIAAASSPRRGFELEGPIGPRGAVRLYGERLTSNLIDDISTPGADQVRALFVLGGNPLGAIPDPARTERGLTALDLLVTIEPYWSETALIADYIIPPRLQYERADLTHPLLEPRSFDEPFVQYTPRLLDDPACSELCEDWFPLWDSARRLGLTVMFDGMPLPVDRAPDQEELLRIMVRNSRVPFEDLSATSGGRVYDVPALLVAQPASDENGRFELLAPDVSDELERCLAADGYARGFSHRLAVRRMREVQNTMYRQFETIRKRVPTNPAWLSPTDMRALDLNEADRVEIRSSEGRVFATARSDPGQRDGVVSVTHGYGGRHGDDDLTRWGTRVNELISMERDIEPINLMPRMTGVPVSVVKVPAATGQDCEQGAAQPVT